MGGTVSSADLGGSSKYSIENVEDRSGEGFHVNSNWTWVRRSLDGGVVQRYRLFWQLLKGKMVKYPFPGDG